MRPIEEESHDIQALRNTHNGALPRYAWPGGYPMYYLDAENNTLCPICANNNVWRDYIPPVVAAGINYEDTACFCDECSARIDAAYEMDDEE